MNDFWSFQRQDDVTNLYLFNEIASEESWWVDVDTPQKFRSQLKGVTGELHVWLDSPGGDVFAGAAIYDMLREYRATGRGKIVAMVSLAASMASLVAMAADEIRISVLGTIMIHEPWTESAGKASVLRAAADTLEHIREAQIDAYVLRTKQSREKILELMHGSDGNGTYMNAQQAIELGFADCLMHDAADNSMKAWATERIRSSFVRDGTRIMAALQKHDVGQESYERRTLSTEALRAELLRACLRTNDD